MTYTKKINSNMSDDLEENLLLREASMSAMLIGQGLTQIRRYDFVQNGYFYSGLLQLTSGTERLLKLIFIYAHRLRNNNQFPTNSELRKKGHNLKELFFNSIAIAKEFDLQNLTSFYFQDELFEKIINFLSDYAMQARYYNLDILTGRQQKNNIEPLARWDIEVNLPIIKRHFRPNKNTLAKWEFVINSLEEKSYVLHADESGSVINNYRDLVSHSMKIPTKQKYSIFYIYKIIRYLSRLLKNLENNGKFYPFLSEFFIIFMKANKKDILNKKSWNPLPPFKF